MLLEKLTSAQAIDAFKNQINEFKKVHEEN